MAINNNKISDSLPLLITLIVSGLALVPRAIESTYCYFQHPLCISPYVQDKSYGFALLIMAFFFLVCAFYIAYKSAYRNKNIRKQDVNSPITKFYNSNLEIFFPASTGILAKITLSPNLNNSVDYTKGNRGSLCSNNNSKALTAKKIRIYIGKGILEGKFIRGQELL